VINETGAKKQKVNTSNILFGRGNERGTGEIIYLGRAKAISSIIKIKFLRKRKMINRKSV